MKRYTAIAAVLFATSAFAQMKETVNVNVVEVPVSVVDSSGNPVRGLTAANFEVYDGGKKQTITSFDKIDFQSNETANAISPLNPAARRSFLLLFDLGFSSPKSLARAQDAARNFVKTAVQARDLVGVGTIDNDHGFRLQTAFTTDRELVESVIADPTGFRGNDPLQIANKTFVADLTNGDSAKTPQPAGSGNAAIASVEMAERQQQLTHSNEQYVRTRVEKQVDYLGQLAKTLRAVPGRKQVILLSEGFDAKYLQGRDARESEAANRENDAVTSGQYWKVDSDQRYGSASSLSMLDRMAQAFRASDVVLHAIDIQGVRVQNDEAGSNFNSNAGLFTISRPTGGEVFQNSNDLKNNFARMLRAQEVVYVLAFQGPSGNSGKYHDLKVKLVNAGGRVNYRTGYYENGGETSTERALTTAEVIVNDIPQDDVHVAAFAAAFPAGNGNAQVPIILDITGADLLKQAHGNTAAAEVFVYAFDDEGVVRDRLYQRLTFDIKKVADRLKSGVRFYGTLVLPPGSYAIKSLVRAGEPAKNESEKRGYARTNVIVPKAGAVAVLPPIPIDEQPKWLLVRGTERGVGGTYPFELNGQNFIPSATASNKVALIIYGAAANELTWETTPKTKLLGTIPIPGGTKLVLQLDDPAQVSTLQVTVHKKGVADAQTSSVAVLRP
ncbi:MAG TPA: VWA domain-containing protein [Thermoanaerobaculia bacterium]|jgi:VWFA-related protein|nr:VWA domain-containing protein [Thermoanaerobaculia bacterium]